MVSRCEMPDALNVFRPANLGRILRAGDDHSSLNPAARRLNKELVEDGLAIVAVGSHIAEIPAGNRLLRKILKRVDRTVERNRAASAELFFDAAQQRAAGEREI